jgi:cytochrome c oxidase subunit 2
MVVLMRLLVLVLLTAALAATDPSALSAQLPPADQVVEVTAERFSFTPSLIKSRVGTVMEFRVKSDDTLHGFRILGTDINVDVPKRGKGTAVVRYTPTEPGKYTFECSHTCGAGHAFMRGTIEVTK